MLAGVGQGLLDDPVDGSREHLVGLRSAVQVDRGAQRLAGGKDPVHHLSEILQARGGLDRPHRLAQHGEQGTQVPHGALGLLSHALGGGPRIVLTDGAG